MAKISKRLETQLKLNKFIELSPLTQCVFSKLVLSFQPSVIIQLQVSSVPFRDSPPLAYGFLGSSSRTSPFLLAIHSYL